MPELFTYAQGSLLLRLLIAHIIADFFLQTDKSVDSKKQGLKSPSFWIHGLIVAALTLLFAWGQITVTVLLIITLSHLAFDYFKIMLMRTGRQWPQKELLLFSIDQLLHVCVIIFGWLMLINGYDKMEKMSHWLLTNYQIALVILGLLVVMGPVAFLIKFLTQRWADDIFTPHNGLKDAGKWIGMLERMIVYTLVLLNQFAAIGFLITAKSILRLIDKPERLISIGEEKKLFNTRMHTEYVLIGTFLSFGIAIIVGVFISWLMKM